MFSKILTLSLNPVMDITMWISDFELGEENEVKEEIYDPAGKAVNVSRVLAGYGVDSTALIVAGKVNADKYFAKLAEENIKTDVVLVDGSIRENISLVIPNKNLTRLMRRGFELKNKAMSEVEKLLGKYVTENSLTVVAGKPPEGMSQDGLVTLCEKIKEKGGLVALDSMPLSYEHIVKIKPYIIKPNIAEFKLITGMNFENLEQLKQGILAMNKEGIEHVIVSLGEEGLVYSSSEGVFLAQVPQVDVLSSVGAGDSSLAGFIMAMHYGETSDKCARMAAAFGTASCLINGTNPPRKITVAMLMDRIEIKKI